MKKSIVIFIAILESLLVAQYSNAESQPKEQYVKPLLSALMCGKIADKTTKKKYRVRARNLAAASCGFASHDTARKKLKGKKNATLWNYLSQISEPGIQVFKNRQETISVEFDNEFVAESGNKNLNKKVLSYLPGIAEALKLFPAYVAIIATADPNDDSHDFKGVGYERAVRARKILLRNGAPPNRVTATGLGKGSGRAITQVDFVLNRQ